MNHPRMWMALLCLACALCASGLAADSKSESLHPLNEQPPAKTTGESELRSQLETEYRAQLEKRVAQEKISMEGSLHSLWMSNAAVWTVLFTFVVLQALSARKRSAEIERLRRSRQGDQA
ncbi:MAG: hypothetical protein IPP14_10465 [Planctomycetes bacterium]|nr:hypothetical protein [Planctomycetota bacterium]